MIFLPFHKKFNEMFTGNAKWPMKLLWFMLFCVLFLILCIVPEMKKEGVGIRKEYLLHVVGLFFFFTVPLFIFMQTGDWSKRVKNIFLKILVVLIHLHILLIWLVVMCMWIVDLID